MQLKRCWWRKCAMIPFRVCTYRLEFWRKDLSVIIIHQPLNNIWPTYKAYSTINEAKTVRQCSSLLADHSIKLQNFWAMVPINKIGNFDCDRRDLGDRPAKLGIRSLHVHGYAGRRRDPRHAKTLHLTTKRL